MKIMGKIVYIITEIIFTLLTLIIGATVAYEQYIYSQAVKSEMPLINYDGKIYEKDQLVAMLAEERNIVLITFIFILVITVLLYVIGISGSKKRKLAAGS